jgi:hypothetical protein
MTSISFQDSICSEASCISEVSYSEDVRRLLRGGEIMSPSLQVNISILLISVADLRWSGNFLLEPETEPKFFGLAPALGM